MEKTVSVEEKIRRAEEIYARRRGENIGVHINSKNKNKDIRILRKLMIQLAICLTIFLVVVIIQNSNYIFSEDFLNKVNEILSYDVNFEYLLENIQTSIQSIQNKIIGQDENLGGAEELTENGDGNSAIDANNTTEQDNVTQDSNTQNLSQLEQDINTAKSTASFIKPLDQYEISSPYGQRESVNANVPKNHTGIDLASTIGTTIKASTAGEVVLNSNQGDYGKHLKIQIGEISIIYAHCSNLFVNQGDHVEQGQEIAQVGSTGNSTGPHLHFEIRVSERTVDPQDILEL